jgi:prophage tail gpP-like protein
MNDGDVRLTVAGAAISGWQDIRISAGIERCPRDFDIGLTELYPGETSEVSIKNGDPCTVAIGGDLVITGFVDRYMPRIGRDNHSIRITGRGLCEDIVDSAAEWPGGQISGNSALGIATKLAQPYGIKVAAAGDTGVAIPQFNLIIGETAFEIIERVCRFRGLLAYDLPDGSLFLTQVGTQAMASGFTEGQNIEEAEATYRSDELFSDYEAFLQSMDVLNDLGSGGNLLAHVTDPNMARHRLKTIIAEAGGGGLDVAKQRVAWECARRFGRSRSVKLTCDSWRDSAGTLWTPNMLAPVTAPHLKLAGEQWIIGEVDFIRNDVRGTIAELLLMPPNAFLPEPILLQPVFADVPPGGAPAGTSGI